MDWQFATEEAYIEQGNLERVRKSPKPKVVKQKMEKNIVYWEQKNGQKIDIDTMTIEHLRNTLKMIVSRKLLIDKPQSNG